MTRLAVPALLLLALSLAACPGGAPTAQPTPIAGVVVDLAKVTVTKPVDGRITVSGAVGTATGGKVTTVTLTVVREVKASPAPAGYRLQHLTGGLAITSGFAAVRADGGFDATTIGDPERPIQSGDELNLIPQNGTSQAGFPASIWVP